MARTTIRTEDITASEVTTAKMATDPTNADNLASGSVPLARLGNVDTSGITANQDDIALLGFKVAANGSLAKYNLVDQAIDAFEDASGVDASASTNEMRSSSGKYYSGGGSGSGSGGTATTYTYDSVDYKVHTFLADSNFVLDVGAGNVDALLVGGGGGGGGHSGSGGGAGGVLREPGIAISSGTHAVDVGDGGAGTAGGGLGTSGDDTTFNMGTTFTAIGGGYGTNYSAAPGAGGSGGGSSRNRNDASGKALQPTSTDGGYGNIGGETSSTGGEPGHGGGGAGGAGAVGNNQGGAGGAGKNNFITDATETAALLTAASIGVGGYLAGGAGGAGHQGQSGGAAGSGGGGAGGSGFSGAGGDGTANTGSGGGGGAYGSPEGPGGDGGKGVAVIRYIDGAFVVFNNMTLVSNATTAVDGAPTTGDLVITYTDGAGTATVNTDIKAYISRNGSAYTSAVTLVSQGTTGGHTILTANGVDLSGITTGTSMRWKIETLNQSAAKETRIQAVSLGWS